jgi:hypothetical protein
MIWDNFLSKKKMLATRMAQSKSGCQGLSVIVSPIVKESPFIRFLRTNSKNRVPGFCKFLSSCKTLPHYDLCDGLLITLQIQW